MRTKTSMSHLENLRIMNEAKVSFEINEASALVEVMCDMIADYRERWSEEIQEEFVTRQVDHAIKRAKEDEGGES